MKLTLETCFTAKEFAAACHAASETCGLSRCPVAPFKCPLGNGFQLLVCSSVTEKDWQLVEAKDKETK